jgi:hypothetical protein
MENSKNLVIYQKVDRTSSAIEQIKIRHDWNICNNKTTGHQSVSSDLIGICFMTYFLCHNTFFNLGMNFLYCVDLWVLNVIDISVRGGQWSSFIMLAIRIKASIWDMAESFSSPVLAIRINEHQLRKHEILNPFEKYKAKRQQKSTVGQLKYQLLYKLLNVWKLQELSK